MKPNKQRQHAPSPGMGMVKNVLQTQPTRYICATKRICSEQQLLRVSVRGDNNTIPQRQSLIRSSYISCKYQQAL